jgi:DNA-binding sugar fermentation-stimulating protein
MFQIQNSQSVQVIKRPSAYCKTPYVADVSLDSDMDTSLAHCPALGCCGLSDKGCNVIVVPLPESKKTKCKYRVELAYFKERDNEIIVGINPKLAETLMFTLLEKNICPFLNVSSFEREKTFLNSRFDFTGIDSNGRPFVMEIKNVPLADYVDVPKKERKKHNTDHIPFDQKIAYFPDGYRKNSTDVVSPRALKHITELEIIANTTEYRAIMCYVIQRTDVSLFQPSNIDLTYKKAVQKAVNNGVEIYAPQFSWNKHGTCTFTKMTPINLSD